MQEPTFYTDGLPLQAIESAMYLVVHLIGGLRWNKNIDAPRNNGSGTLKVFLDETSEWAQVRSRSKTITHIWDLESNMHHVCGTLSYQIPDGPVPGRQIP